MEDQTASETIITDVAGTDAQGTEHPETYDQDHAKNIAQQLTTSTSQPTTAIQTLSPKSNLEAKSEKGFPEIANKPNKVELPHTDPAKEGDSFQNTAEFFEHNRKGRGTATGNQFLREIKKRSEQTNVLPLDGLEKAA